MEEAPPQLIPFVIQICTKSSAGNHTNHPHMDCAITGRPCCIGTKGRWVCLGPEHCSGALPFSKS